MLAIATKTVTYPVNTSNINRLISLTKEVSHRMPSGLTRDERKQWAMKLRKKG